MVSRSSVCVVFLSLWLLGRLLKRGPHLNLLSLVYAMHGSDEDRGSYSPDFTMINVDWVYPFSLCFFPLLFISFVPYLGCGLYVNPPIFASLSHFVCLFCSVCLYYTFGFPVFTIFPFHCLCFAYTRTRRWNPVPLVRPVPKYDLFHVVIGSLRFC